MELFGAWQQIDWFPLRLSLQVAGMATVISLGVGLALAYVLARHSFRGRDALDALITLPIVLPPTVLGYYLLVVIGRSTPLGQAFEAVFGFPLVFTWQAAVVAATFHSVPLLVKSARAALESVDRNMENAARTLGVSEWRIFFRITLPLARRSILAATVFAFARALGDFGVTIMIAGQHSRQDADHGGGDLRRRASGQHAAGQRDGADSFRRGDCDSLWDEPAGKRAGVGSPDTWRCWNS